MYALNESAALSLEINGRSGKTLLFYIMDAQGTGGGYRGGKLAFHFLAVKTVLKLDLDHKVHL